MFGIDLESVVIQPTNHCTGSVFVQGTAGPTEQSKGDGTTKSIFKLKRNTKRRRSGLE